MLNTIACIAFAIYFEGRSEDLRGQVGVANVIVNRVASPRFPDSPCEVVKQGRYWQGHPLRDQCQFSYWCDGKPELIDDAQAYTVALSIAVNWRNLVDVTGGATYYHRDDVHPYWINADSPKLQIGRHIFYREAL